MPDNVKPQIASLVDLLLEEVERRVRNGQFLRQHAERPQPKGLFTLQEAAEYLGMTPRALYAATSRRQFPFVKMGRRVRFREEDLKAFVDANLVKPEPQVTPSGRKRGGW